MRKINLLPWRETLRKEKQQQFVLAFTFSLALVVSLFIGLHVYIAHQQNDQTQRNTLLQNELIQQNQMASSMKIMEEKTRYFTDKTRDVDALQTSRAQTSALLNEIVLALPNAVSLTKVTRIDQQITIEGKTLSKAALSDFMHNLQTATPFHPPVLDVMKGQANTSIEKNENTDRIQLFTLHFQKNVLN